MKSTYEEATITALDTEYLHLEERKVLKKESFHNVKVFGKKCIAFSYKIYTSFVVNLLCAKYLSLKKSVQIHHFSGVLKCNVLQAFKFQYIIPRFDSLLKL